MLWEEDPRFQEGTWRFFRGAVIFAFGLGLLAAMITGDFNGMAHFAGVVALFGLASLVVALVALVGGLAMKGLFFLGWCFPAWLGKVARKLKH